VAIALGPCLVAVGLAASGIAALWGQPLLWPAGTVTLSEAMAMRDQGEVVRQVALGRSLDVRYDVYDAIRADRHTPATPLEAAIATRELYMFMLGVNYGAQLDASRARGLQCLADAKGATEIAAFLATRFGPTPDCAALALPW
jgi:hypothetical protein